MRCGWNIELPPAFYTTTMQSTDFPFPHAEADTMTWGQLRRFWYSDYLFDTPSYCVNPTMWPILRETPVIQSLAPFFMRLKCILEHLDIAEYTELYTGLDRIATITQVLVYWYLQGYRDPLIDQWTATAVTATTNTAWCTGVPLSVVKRQPKWLSVRIREYQHAFRPLLEFADTVVLRNSGEMKNRPIEEIRRDGIRNSTGESYATDSESGIPV